MALLGDNDECAELVDIEMRVSLPSLGTTIARSQYSSEVKPQGVVLLQGTLSFSFLSLGRS